MRDQRDALLVLLLLLLLLLVIVWPQCDLVLARHRWNGLWDAGRRCGDRRTRLGAAICIADAARHGDGAHCAALHWRTVHSQRRRGWSATAAEQGQPGSRTRGRSDSDLTSASTRASSFSIARAALRGGEGASAAWEVASAEAPKI